MVAEGTIQFGLVNVPTKFDSRELAQCPLSVGDDWHYDISNFVRSVEHGIPVAGGAVVEPRGPDSAVRVLKLLHAVMRNCDVTAFGALCVGPTLLPTLLRADTSELVLHVLARPSARRPLANTNAASAPKPAELELATAVVESLMTSLEEALAPRTLRDFAEAVPDQGAVGTPAGADARVIDINERIYERLRQERSGGGSRLPNSGRPTKRHQR
jgi:hypothetical protein